FVPVLYDENAYLVVNPTDLSDFLDPANGNPLPRVTPVISDNLISELTKDKSDINFKVFRLADVSDRVHFPFVTTSYYGTVFDPASIPVLSQINVNGQIIDHVESYWPVWPASLNSSVPVSFWPVTQGDDGQEYPVENIHHAADVDNDGDEFKDAIWIPLAS